MSEIKDGRYPLNIGGKKYHLLFSLNALDDVQDKFGGFDKLTEALSEKNKDWIKNTKWLFTLLINEGMDEDQEELTERQVGRLINTGNLAEVQSSMMRAFSLGVSGNNNENDESEDESDTDIEGNKMGEQE